jgi:hypothetical protein
MQENQGSSSPPGEKRKLDKRNFMFINLDGQEVMKQPGEVNGQAFRVSVLDNCTVWIMDHCEQVLVRLIV